MFPLPDQAPTISQRLHRPLLIALLAVLLAACASTPDGTTPASPGAGRAITSLMAKADAKQQSGEWEQAAALLERALRIEPRNALLWQRLAEVRLKQGRYAQAISLANKSSSLAPGNTQLRERNQRIIEEAQALGGGRG